MRKCEGCQTDDIPWFDPTQECRCTGDRKIGVQYHEANCNRVRHSIRPYRIRLDWKSDKARLTKNGFALRQHSGMEFAEKLLCQACIIAWEFRELQRRDYEKTCKAKRASDEETYYQMLARN